MVARLMVIHPRTVKNRENQSFPYCNIPIPQEFVRLLKGILNLMNIKECMFLTKKATNFPSLMSWIENHFYSQKGDVLRMHYHA